jgi:hypothetical protein
MLTRIDALRAALGAIAGLDDVRGDDPPSVVAEDLQIAITRARMALVEDEHAAHHERERAWLAGDRKLPAGLAPLHPVFTGD